MTAASSAVEPVALHITDPTMVGEARRVAMAAALRLSWNEEDRGKLAIIVSEAAKNVSLHGKGGQVLLQPLEDGGIEVVALDKGPGIPDLARAMRDGFSTAGTAGLGLGGMQRLSNLFDVYSQPGAGTAVVCRVWPTGVTPPTEPLETGAVNIPVKGETICGDAYASQQQPGRAVFLVVDGLGHGPTAGEAAREAQRIFHENAGGRPAEILALMHDALKKTRGAAAAVAEVLIAEKLVRFSGLGNIAATVLHAGTSRSMVSQNGTLGAEARRIHEYMYPWQAGSVLVMNSDGVSTWRLDKHAGLAIRRPTTIAAVLYRDFARGRDDATVLVAKG